MQSAKNRKGYSAQFVGQRHHCLTVTLVLFKHIFGCHFMWKSTKPYLH